MLINNAVITGSFIVNGVDVTGITGSSAISSSFLALSSSYLATSASYVITSASYAQSSASLSIRTSNLETTSSTLVSASSSFAAQSASLSTRLTGDETNISTLTTASASFAVVSASFSSTSQSVSSRVTLIEGQYATTGSNIFSGPQYINQASNAIGFASTASLYTDGGLRVTKDSFVSGTAYFNNVVVYGTSSIQYITSSQVNFGTNIITVNTDTPAVRFGGLAVFDSGSTQLTGSILWDSQNNRWIYSNPSGSTYNSAMLMNGPRNTGSLGSEQGTLNNYVMKGQGGDHITSSQIIDDGTTVSIPGNLQVTGSALFGSTVQANGNLLMYGNDITYYGSTPRIVSAGYSYPIKIDGSTVLLNSASGGNVGIGTTSPSTISTYRVLEVTGPNTSTGGMIRTNISDNSIIGKFYTNSTGVWVSAETSHPLILETANTERMRISSGGNISIGSASTITDSNLVNIIGNQSSVNIGVVLNNTNVTYARIYAIQNVNGNFNIRDYTASVDRIVLNASGSLGLGITPSAWNTIQPVFQIGYTAFSAYQNTQAIYSSNAVYTSGWKYISNGAATYYSQNETGAGQHAWKIAPSGTAGNAISFTQAMTLNASGNLSINNTNDTYRLDVNGTLRVSTPNRNFFVTSNAYSISDGTLSSGIGMDGDGLYLGNVTSATGWTIANPQVTIRSSGNVGIGTSSPTGGISGTEVALELSNSNVAVLALTSTAASGKKYQIYSSNDGGLFFRDATAAAQRMNITSGGNIGINTTSPVATNLVGSVTSVKSYAGDTPTSTTAQNYYLNQSNLFLFGRNAGITMVSNANEEGIIAFANPYSAYIGGIRYDTLGDATGGSMKFQTGGTSERMRISNAGTVTIQIPTSGVALLANGRANEWTTQAQGSSTTGQSFGAKILAGTNSSDTAFLVQNQAGSTDYFKVRGDGYLQSPTTYNNTTATGANLSISTSGFIERSTSSIKYKKDVINYDKGLTEILQMRPVYYKGKGENDGDKQFAGLIAEEIHDLGLTEFVQYAEDNSPDALSYGNMIALMTKAIQELSAKVDAQAAEINELKNK